MPFDGLPRVPRSDAFTDKSEKIALAGPAKAFMIKVRR